MRSVSASSKILFAEWRTRHGLSMMVGTTNATQVLITTRGRNLVERESLVEMIHLEKELDISWHDLNPVGIDPY